MLHPTAIGCSPNTRSTVIRGSPRWGCFFMAKIKTFSKNNMGKTGIYEAILSAVVAETEISELQILSHSKQSDIVEARCLLFHYLQRAGFYPSQIARMTNQSRQCVNCLLLSYEGRIEYSGNAFKGYVIRLDKNLSEYIIPPAK